VPAQPAQAVVGGSNFPKLVNCFGGMQSQKKTALIWIFSEFALFITRM
jgi:hypothetical protein